MTTRKSAPRDYATTIRRSVINGTVKLFILQRAQYEPVYGGSLTKALHKFGYAMSPGTLYPLLHTLEQAKLLRSHTSTVQGRVRRYYEITPLGRACYSEGWHTLAALVEEMLFEKDLQALHETSRGKKLSR